MGSSIVLWYARAAPGLTELDGASPARIVIAGRPSNRTGAVAGSPEPPAAVNAP